MIHSIPNGKYSHQINVSRVQKLMDERCTLPDLLTGGLKSELVRDPLPWTLNEDSDTVCSMEPSSRPHSGLPHIT